MELRYPFLQNVTLEYRTVECCFMTTILNDDNYKTGISSSAICDCGVERETIEHILLQCSNYTEARKAIFDRIEALCLSSHQKFHSNVNEHLLLAPSDSSIITKNDDYYIKEALLNSLLQWIKVDNT